MIMNGQVGFIGAVVRKNHLGLMEMKLKNLVAAKIVRVINLDIGF